MQARQATSPADALKLRSERLGALPLINHFIERLGLEAHLDAFVPSWDRRTRLPYAKAIGVLVRYCSPPAWSVRSSTSA